MNLSFPSFILSFAVLILFLSSGSAASAASTDDEFGTRFSGTAPAALGEDPDIFADFLAGYEPAAGGFDDPVQNGEKPEKSRNTYTPGSGGGYRAPRLSGDNSRYLVRKRSGE